MKSISLHQPWASAIAIGLKIHETRSWMTYYRGPLAIHAALTPKIKEPQRQAWEKLLHMMQGSMRKALPFGAVICTCELIECLPTHLMKPASEFDRLLGDCGHGRYAWRLANVKVLETPIPWKGRQGLFEVSL